MNDRPPIVSLTLPELFSCLQVASEINWGAAKSVLMQRISRLLDLPGQAAVPRCAPEDGAVRLTDAQVRVVALAAIDARFHARDAGQHEGAQFIAALNAAAVVVAQQCPGLRADAPALARMVSQLLREYDAWIASARHGPVDDSDGAAGAIDAAVHAIVQS